MNVPPAIVGTPAGHDIVWVCPASADPVNVSAPTVNALPGFTPAIFENAPEEAPARLPDVVATVTVPFVPAGVPALTDAVVGTPAGQEIAPSLNAPLAFVGTPAGQEIAPSEYAPLVFEPAGVKLTVPLLPAGVNAAVPFVPAGV